MLTVITPLIQDRVPLGEKLDQILNWIDLPLEQRPQLILGGFFYHYVWAAECTLLSAYEPSLDQAGHKYGPLSVAVNVSMQLFSDGYIVLIHRR